jgi:hypothetical protein
MVSNVHALLRNRDEVNCLRHVGREGRGWLPVTLVLGDYEFVVLASNVLNDPYLELVEFTASLAEVPSSTPFPRVCFWLEPDGYALDARQSADDRVVLSIMYDEAFVPPMAHYEMKTEHTCVLERGLLHRALLVGVTRWFADHAPAIARNWSQDLDVYRRALAKVRSERKKHR